MTIKPLLILLLASWVYNQDEPSIGIINHSTNMVRGARFNYCDPHAPLVRCDLWMNLSTYDGSNKMHRFIAFQPNATPSAVNMTGEVGAESENVFQFDKREAESICAKYDNATLPQVFNPDLYRDIYMIGRAGVGEAVFPLGLNVLEVQQDPSNPKNQRVLVKWQSGHEQWFNSTKTHDLAGERQSGQIFKWLTPEVGQDSFFQTTEPYWFSGGVGIYTLDSLSLICHRIYDQDYLPTMMVSERASTHSIGAETPLSTKVTTTQSDPTKHHDRDCSHNHEWWTECESACFFQYILPDHPGHIRISKANWFN